MLSLVIMNPKIKIKIRKQRGIIQSHPIHQNARAVLCHATLCYACPPINVYCKPSCDSSPFPSASTSSLRLAMPHLALPTPPTQAAQREAFMLLLRRTGLALEGLARVREGLLGRFGRFGRFGRLGRDGRAGRDMEESRIVEEDEEEESDAESDEVSDEVSEEV